MIKAEDRGSRTRSVDVCKLLEIAVGGRMSYRRVNVQLLPPQITQNEHNVCVCICVHGRGGVTLAFEFSE
jgi:hypothetical protein